MVAVDEIDVGVAGRSEEDSVAGGDAAIGVRAGIDGSEVGFGFYDASGEEGSAITANEEFAEEFAGDVAGIAGEERARERGEAAERWSGHELENDSKIKNSNQANSGLA
jgi:hypothetical protein